MSQKGKHGQLYAKLNNIENGSFHDERVAFTEVGSRLLLSMSAVNPQDVSSNILSLLNRNTTDWIQENIKYETRRNLIYTLERTVSFSDAFKNSALALAKLATQNLSFPEIFLTLLLSNVVSKSPLRYLMC